MSPIEAPFAERDPTMKSNVTWILVADGARARILKTEGWGKGLIQLRHAEHEESHRRTAEQGTDRPGRTREIADGTPSAYSETDWQRHEKEVFAREMAKQLDRGAGKGAFDRLVLAAPPKVLGDLRKAMDDHTARMVTVEIDKDLTHLSLDELTERLEQVTPV